jgi:hypothetical protein
MREKLAEVREPVEKGLSVCIIGLKEIGKRGHIFYFTRCDVGSI